MSFALALLGPAQSSAFSLVPFSIVAETVVPAGFTSCNSYTVWWSPSCTSHAGSAIELMIVSRHWPISIVALAMVV